MVQLFLLNHVIFLLLKPHQEHPALQGPAESRSCPHPAPDSTSFKCASIALLLFG